MEIIKKLIFITSKKKLLALIFLFIFGSFEVALSEIYKKNPFFVQNILDCYENSFLEKCKNIISYTERVQLQEYRKGKFRCQTSLLGAQTELIKRIYFDTNEESSTKIGLPFVIKNCKL